MAKEKKQTKKEWLAEQVAKAVGAGRPVAVETVDFADPNRPKTCLEVDFPILPINQIAAIEGNAGKPIYQMSKWWARRRSSVFRALLLAASMKAPEDPAEAAKAVWDVYYANHQKKGALSHLKVADIFMGGGTTIVEGSRLGMQMFGVDLNPVAWFVVKNELAQVDIEEVEELLADIEAEVKPQIMPFYACDCPRGHKGKWTQLSTGKVMNDAFDPLSLSPEERKDYRYQGPEIIYVFWAKHGPCQRTGCGHRTPIMTKPVMAVKTLKVKAWLDRKCNECGEAFDEERDEARMAPGVSLVVAEDEAPYAILDAENYVTCPHCGHRQPSRGIVNQKWENKSISLSLLVHPQWLAGSPKAAPDGSEYGGSTTDTPEATAAWNEERARKIKLIEVRGNLPQEIICPDTGININTDTGTVPKKSHYECGACGTGQDVLKTVKASEKTSPVAMYAIQGHCPHCEQADLPYRGRFFSPVENVKAYNLAEFEWHSRKNSDLESYYPKTEVSHGLETSVRTPLNKYNYKEWHEFFNSRQLLIHSLLLKSLDSIKTDENASVCDFVLGGLQQFLRLNNMFCIWNIQADKLEPFLSKNNLQPPNRPIENSVFHSLGRGNWNSCQKVLIEGLNWAESPWELVTRDYLDLISPSISKELKKAKSKKTVIEDPVQPNRCTITCGSSTELKNYKDEFIDLVITDPPFGDILQYSELSDFFYSWLCCQLKPGVPFFSASQTPKSLEVVENQARHKDDSSGFYKRLMTLCWKEAGRILKPSGILAFTFHHDKDAPWVSVLESLFDAGFYLEGAYPVRSDETKGEGSKPGTFGAQKVEFDIVHICRKRTEDTQPISWGKMRREVLRAVRQLREILEIHEKAGLPKADLQVIKRGKALEYYSRHYGKVYVDDGKLISVKEALVGINQLLDEDNNNIERLPPVDARPLTRQFLRIFDGHTELPRDQIQKYLRGTGISPQEFEELGWCEQRKKVYYLTSPLDIAQAWQGKHRQRITNDYDQAMILIGACFEGSGINANDTLKNPNFRPHQALSALLDWHSQRGATADIRQAAVLALRILQAWERKHPQEVSTQLSFFGE